MAISDKHKGGEQKPRPRLAICLEEALVKEPDCSKSSSNWEVITCKNFQEILRLSSSGDLDAVAVSFDPFDHNSRQNFLYLAKHQRKGRPFIVSYSRAKPPWIENLVFSVGSNLHIRDTPKIKEIIKILETHFRYAIAYSKLGNTKTDNVQTWSNPLAQTI